MTLMSLVESLSITTISCDLAIVTHGEKMHVEYFILVVNQRFRVIVLDNCQPKPSVDNPNDVHLFVISLIVCDELYMFVLVIPNLDRQCT